MCRRGGATDFIQSSVLTAFASDLSTFAAWPASGVNEFGKSNKSLQADTLLGCVPGKRMPILLQADLPTRSGVSHHVVSIGTYKRRIDLHFTVHGQTCWC